MRRTALLALTLGLCAGLSAGTPVAAQNSRETERKLAQARKELQAVAAERRRLEGQRGAISRELRAADEKVARSARALRELEQQVERERAELQRLQARRAGLARDLDARREELARLVRASDRQRDAAPLKALLAQDRVADAQRLLAYQRYLQRERTRRIAAITAELQEVERLEAAIVARREQLARIQAQQRQQLAALEEERRQRAALMAKIDARYQDRRAREQALGRDVKGLQSLLRKLRAAAARAEAQRRAPGPAAPPREGAPRAPAAAPQVGGLGWPVSGALLAGYRRPMPDGRSSDGLLIAAPAGTPVKAVADGTVVYAEWMTGYGLLMIIDHGNGYMSLYAHNETLLREVGAQVKRGDAVATVGSSGGHGRAALYFELRRNGRTVDPGVWLRR